MDENKPHRVTIAVDMDGVLADTVTHFIQYYKAESGVQVDPQTLRGVPENIMLPDKTAVRRYVHTPGFFRTAPLIEGSVSAIQSLMVDFDVFIVSAAMEFPLSLFEKQQWLKEHFPFISWKNIVLCGDKRIIKADYLIDDHLKNLDYFSGIPLLFTAAHNVNVNRHHRMNNWYEILAYFKSLRGKV